MDVELLTGLISEAEIGIHNRPSEVLSSTSRRSPRITTQSVLDGLAQILVSKPSGEVVAVGAQVSDEQSRIILTVATNDGHVPAYMRNHLHRVWASLKDLANIFQKYSFRSISPVWDSPADVIAKVEGFVQLLWEYSLERYKHFLHKPFRSIPQMTGFDEFIEEARYLDSKNPQGDKTKQFSDILRSMKSINKSLQSGNSDYTVLYACFVQINDCVKNVLRDHRHTCAPRVIQYLNKISSFPTAVHALLVFAASTQLRSRFLLNMILEVRYILTKGQVITLPEQHVWQEIACAALRKYELTLSPWDPTPGTFKRLKRKQYRASTNTEVPIHCELAVALVLLSEKDPTTSTFAYIGASKLSCFACWRFLFCIRNKKTENQIEPCFNTRGTNGKACFPWKYPGQELSNSICKGDSEVIYKKFYSELADRYAECIAQNSPVNSEYEY